MNIDADTWMGTMGMLFVLVILALGVWFVATMGKKGMDMQQAKSALRANSARGQEYKRLAEEATRAQAEVATQLKRLESIEVRLTEVERMLRAVDEPTLAR